MFDEDHNTNKCHPFHDTQIHSVPQIALRGKGIANKFGVKSVPIYNGKQFLFTPLWHQDLVGVKDEKTFKEKYGYVEKGFAKCLKIFFGVDFKTEYNVYNTKNGKNSGSPFRCDFYNCIDNKHIVFEFNGPIHYQIPFKILTDKRKIIRINW